MEDSRATSLTGALGSGHLVLDGGLGTLLEQHGHDLTSALWSARMLVENPDAIRAAHSEFFTSGARVGISSSYQVSYEAMHSLGIDGDGTDALLRRSIELVREAASEFDDGIERWTAASVGPYGAMLADGSEYRGDYGLSVAALRDWHAPRLFALAAASPDVLALETIPCLAEVEALAAVLDGSGLEAWMSVTVAMGALRSGETLADAFAIAADSDEIVAVGINCSDPLDVAGAIATARATTTKPIVVYPNSGEQWDAKNRRWMGRAGFPDSLVREWVAAGASLVGGCCRVGPVEIGAMAAAIAL
jgi:homocysteine S-methyltransferase